MIDARLCDEHHPDQTQGTLSNPKNLPLEGIEPAGHSIVRSRHGLAKKIHHAVDGHGLPLVIVVTGGQRNDGMMLAPPQSSTPRSPG